MWPIAKDFSEYKTPVVPADMIRYTCGHEDYEEYLRSGFEVASMFNLALNKNFGKLISDFSSILDFGCGSGRVARYVNPTGQFFGCDINRRIANFCAETIHKGQFHQSPTMPPLKFSDAAFDLIYSFSVFSHLSRSVEEVWLAELARVAKPGCVLLVTVHGDWSIEATLGPEREKAEAEGFYYRHVYQRHQTEHDFPDYYEASYHTSEWIRRHWSTHFDIVDIIKGDNPARYFAPGQAFAPQGDVPLIRPMGQDMVVAIRR